MVDVQSRRHRHIEASAYPYLTRPGSSLKAGSQSSIPDRIFALAANINFPYSTSRAFEYSPSSPDRQERAGKD